MCISIVARLVVQGVICSWQRILGLHILHNQFDLTAINLTLLLAAVESRSILLKIYDKILLILIGSNNFGRRHTLA